MVQCVAMVGRDGGKSTMTLIDLHKIALVTRKEYMHQKVTS